MRAHRSALIIFQTVILMIISSCNKENNEILPDEPVKINISNNQVDLIQSGNSFALDIFREILTKNSSGGNVIISPLSISSALSMAINGAEGATRDEMQEALRNAGLSADEINQAYRDLTRALLEVDKRVLISIANSVWTEKNFVVKKPFTDILTNYYNTEQGTFDITNPLAHQAINAWIEDKTNGLIKEMIDKLSPNTVMLLVNAIYFKGKWNSQFDESETLKKPFYKSDGTTVQVPMMNQTSDYRIYDGDGFVMAELPYGQGNYVMDILLPDSRTEGTGFLLPLLTPENLNTWIGSMHETETDISIPRFKFGYKEKLKDVLRSMGMETAFTDLADFSNITSTLPLMISEVTHQAFIETNEEGTEAAAATVVEFEVTSMPTVFTFNADHPFIFMIREVTTNTVLFIGRVDDPLAN